MDSVVISCHLTAIKPTYTAGFKDNVVSYYYVMS